MDCTAYDLFTVLIIDVSTHGIEVFFNKPQIVMYILRRKPPTETSCLDALPIPSLPPKREKMYHNTKRYRKVHSCK